MKYLQVAPVPSPIESWLHTQLEARGVDKAYSRYILSLFQSNDIDQDLDWDFPSTKGLKRLNKKNKHSKTLDTKKLIRAAVIDCLTSASEHNFGIESLVDELYEKLNNKKDKSDLEHSDQPALRSIQNDNDSNNTSCLDQAQKYYDAFPALGGNNHHSVSTAYNLFRSSSSSKHSPWNGKNKKLLLTNSKKLKTNLKNKENQKKLTESETTSSNITKLSNTPATTMEKSSVKRRLFVEVDDPKDSLTSLMEKVDGTKDLWSDSATQSQLSSSGSSSFIQLGFNLTTSIWSDTEPERKAWSSAENDSGLGMSLMLLSPSNSASTQSLAILNHCAERSLFRTVTPGSSKLFENHQPFPIVATPASEKPIGKEENLLTSTKTHFCPIDKAPYYKASSTETEYPNGTTFPISNDMNHIEYEKGEDGTFSYNSEKYMEFKANGVNTECYNLFDPFKPKFKVFAMDKACQTEDPGCDGSEVEELPIIATAQVITCTDADDFYFPGEESIARDIIKSLDDDDSYFMEDEEGPCKKSERLLVDAWAVAWPTTSIWSNSSVASLADDGWPTPTHDYKDIRSYNDKTEDQQIELNELYTNYSIWAPPFPLDNKSNVIICSKSETPIPLGITMGNLKISSDRKRRHSSSQYYGNYMFPCIKSDVSCFQQSITL